MPMLHSLPLAAPPSLQGLLETSIIDLQSWLAERGQPAHRVKQLRRWVLVAGAESFDAMSDLPKSLRQDLGDAFAPIGSRVSMHLAAYDVTHILLIDPHD